MTDISNSEDIIDVRNIIARFEELETERDDRQAIFDDAESGSAAEADAKTALDEWIADNGEEFALLRDLLEEMSGYGGDEQWRGDWYPVSLIRDSYFETAMDDLLEDIGVLPKDLPCYLRVEIDYKALQMDYTSVEFDGVTYWYR